MSSKPKSVYSRPIKTLSIKINLVLKNIIDIIKKISRHFSLSSVEKKLAFLAKKYIHKSTHLVAFCHKFMTNLQADIMLSL